MTSHNRKSGGVNDAPEPESAYTKIAYDPLDTRHYGAVSMPVYQNSLFAFESYAQFEQAIQDENGQFHVYSRGNNPTVEYLERKLAELEGGERAKCFGSGMAAISAAVLSVVGQGDHILCSNQAYGPAREFMGNYLKRFGVETTFVDGSSPEAWKAEARPNTKLLYLESPTSLQFELQDLAAVGAFAKSIGAVTIIDNTWATPVYQQPLRLGIDLVVHSITKYISGHSDCVGGVVIGPNRLMESLIRSEYMLLGGIMTAQTAATVMRGLRTLPLRMERHQSSGLKVARHLSGRPYVRQVNHPGLPEHPQHELALRQMSGFGSLFSIQSDEPLDKLKEWATRLRYFKIGVSWGGFESLVTVHRLPVRSGEMRNFVRFFVGLENPDDLIRDLDDAWASLQDE